MQQGQSCRNTQVRKENNENQKKYMEILNQIVEAE